MASEHTSNNCGVLVFYFKWLLSQRIFMVMVVMGLLFTTIGAALFVGGGSYNVDSYPTTYRMIESLSDFNIFFLIIVVFYSGELIWKERDVKVNLIFDALPYPNYVTIAGKFLAMTFMFAILLLTLIFLGVAIQAFQGYTDFQLPVYLKSLFTDTFYFLLLYTFLGFFIHTMVNHKFVGHAVFVMFFISTLVLNEIGLEHNLFHFASGGLGRFSDMNQFGHYFEPFNWFSLYWFAFAFVLFALVIFFNVRGAEANMKTRWRLGKLRLNRSLVTFSSISLLLFVAAGAFIYYNTNVLNEFQNSDDSTADRAAYEKTLKQYAEEPLLKIVSTYVEIDIFPEERDFNAKGKYTLKNKTEQPIQKVYVQRNVNEDVTDEVSFNVPAKITDAWDDFYFYIYELENPVLPGDSIEMEFTTIYDTKGFKEGGSNTEILHNGTFFNNTYFPTFGYQGNFEITSDDDRKD
ncbi:MAG: aminopeptidase, partial [Bacteroidota bacterium]